MATATKKAATKTAAKGNSGKAAKPEGKAKKKPLAAAIAKETGKSLVSYDEMMAKLRERGQKQAEREALTGAGGMPYMNTEGKEFAINGDEAEEFGDSIQCVVVAAAFHNILYDAKYVPGQKSTPACYSVAMDEEDLKPADNSPVPQAEDCASCEFNEWGSGDNGNGKKCSNRRKLCILLISDLEQGVVRPILMSLPPTALKFWGRYVKAIQRQHKVDPAGVVTRFDFDEDNPQPCPIPTFESMVDEDMMGAVFNTLEDAEEAVLAPLNTDDYVPPNERKSGNTKMGRKGGAGGKAGKAPAKKAAKSAGKSGKPAARGGRR